MEEKNERFLVDSNLIFEALSNNNDNYIYIWDYQSGRYVVSNNLVKDFTIAAQGANFADDWHILVHERDLARINETIDQAVNEKKKQIKLEYQVTNALNEQLWISDKASIRYNDEGIPEMIIGVMHNLLYDGYVDAITGLFMHSKCKETFDTLKANNLVEQVTLMLIGIDEFTSINTLHNHNFGDLVLRKTAQDFLNFLHDRTTMYRYDGDQLLIVSADANKKDFVQLYKKLKVYTSKSHCIEGITYRFSISAGIASYPEDAITWMDLEKAVSIALKSVKETGKNRYAEFSNQIYEEKLYEQTLAKYLADSVDNQFKDFHVVFQPVLYTQSLKVKGAEILLRYKNPMQDLISPEVFIPILEQSNLIIPVGLWVLEQAIQVCKKWVAFNKNFVINVNVSYVQLCESSFCEHVEKLLKTYDLDSTHLTLELTESYFISDVSSIHISMKRLRELHVKIAMDDFGTGYSSLARLSQFNVDVIKIDRSFVQSLHKSKYNRDFVDSVVRLCHNVGMEVCVEGVETKDEQEIICVLNADYVQGFYVSRPILENEFFTTFIVNPKANNSLIVSPNMQLRREQLISDRDVLRAMMDATPLGLNFWNRDFEIISCNAEIIHLFGANDFKDVKNNFMSFSPPYQSDGRESKEKAFEMIEKAFEGECVRFYWEHWNHNKEIIPTEVTAVCIPYMNDFIVASYTRDMCEQRKMEEQIQQFNARLEAILDSSPLCLNLWNRKFENIMCNKAAVELFDLHEQQEYLDRFIELSPRYQPNGMLSSEKSNAYITKAFKEGYQQFKWIHCDLEGNEIPSEITLVRIEGLDEDGGDLIAGYTRDIRTQIKAQKLQTAINVRTRAVLDSSPLACVLWKNNMEIVDCNQVMIQMLKAENKKEIKEAIDTFMPLTQPDGANSIEKKKALFKQIMEKHTIVFEWVYVNKEQEEVPCEVTLVRISLEHEDIIVGYSRDLRELHHTLELNDRLSQIAYYDWLTGVTSRGRFMERLTTVFDASKEDGAFTIIFFDIDHFKSVNDTYGHGAGDVVLKRVVKAIEKMIPNNAIIGRYGGDEFIILLENLSKDQAAYLMKNVIYSISQMTFCFDDKEFTTSISMGASSYLHNDESCQNILNRADKALYQAKDSGRNGYAILSRKS